MDHFKLFEILIFIVGAVAFASLITGILFLAVFF